MAKPTNQHWVPRFYLRQFATIDTRNTARPQVWIFARDGDGAPQLTNVKNIAARRHLYSPKMESGERDWEMEDKLADLETLVGNIWDRLAEGFVDFDGTSNVYRKIVALFMATLYFRHPSFIDKFKQLHARIVSEIDMLPSDDLGNPLIFGIVDKGIVKPFDNTGYAEYKGASSEDFKKMFTESIGDNSMWFAESLIQKRWSIIFSEQPMFITSDTPVVMTNTGRMSFGLNTPGTLVMFPISPTRVLIIDDQLDQPQNQYYRLADHGPGPINQVIWHHSTRFMISPRHTDSVCAEILSYSE